MNREDRLRKVAPGAAPDLIAALAALPAAEVEKIAALARQARRDEREHQAGRKRQRKADARKHRHYDVAQLAERNIRMLVATARQGSGDLDILGWLAQSGQHIDTLIKMAVGRLRAEGYSDADIGAALGITRQAVWQKFPRKASFAPDRRTGAA